MAVCPSQAERDRKGPRERASLSCLGESTGRMEGESSLHRDTPCSMHPVSLSLAHSFTDHCSDRHSSPGIWGLRQRHEDFKSPKCRADRKGCGGGERAWVLSLSRSFPASSFPQRCQPPPRPDLTLHNKQLEGSENGHHATFSTPLRGLSLLPGPLLQTAYSHQEISRDPKKPGQSQSPPNKATSSDTEKLPSGTSSLSFTLLWVPASTAPLHTHTETVSASQKGPEPSEWGDGGSIFFRRNNRLQLGFLHHPRATA